MNVGIVGATGYAGVELIRLLLAHPSVAIKRLTSRAEAGRRVDDLFPSLRGHLSLIFEDPAESRFDDCDLVFFATRLVLVKCHLDNHHSFKGIIWYIC